MSNTFVTVFVKVSS